MFLPSVEVWSCRFKTVALLPALLAFFSCGNPSRATISPVQARVIVVPSTVRLKAAMQFQFQAVVTGTDEGPVTWSLSGMPGDITPPGLISDAGLYQSPSPLLQDHTFLLTATSANKSAQGTAQITVMPLENQETQSFPIKLGASGVNENTQTCCTGTLGALVQDQQGMQYILSNNHVIGRLDEAQSREDIIQPGYIDNFCQFTSPRPVAQFTYAPPIEISNVDAAIAQVMPNTTTSDGSIIGLGGVNSDGSYAAAPPASSLVLPVPGMTIVKSGRTTGLTCGQIEAVDTTIEIQFPAACGASETKNVVFNHLIVSNTSTKAGDSGALFVKADTAEPVALLLGLTSDGQLAIANPISDVLDALDSGTGKTFTIVGGASHEVPCIATEPQASSRTSSRTQLGQEAIMHANRVKESYKTRFLRMPGVIGVGTGRSSKDSSQASIIVFVSKSMQTTLPSEIEGLELRVVKTEPFTAGTDTRRRIAPVKVCSK